MVLLQKHPLEEKSTGPNPTDRAKSGTKRSILVDGKGVPLGVSVDGANRHDMKMSKATIQSIVIQPYCQCFAAESLHRPLNLIYLTGSVVQHSGIRISNVPLLVINSLSFPVSFMSTSAS